MAEVKRYLGALSCTVMAPLALWYLYPEPLTMYIATISELFAGFRAWLTSPVLFILMNGVVVALAYTSGLVKQRPPNWQHTSDYEELEDLSKSSTRKNAEDDDADEEDDEEGEHSFYPEVLSSFFGDGGTVTRSKPLLKRSASSPSPSAERKGRSLYPTISTSLSQKLKPSPSLFASPSPPKNVSPQPLLKLLQPTHTVPRAVTFDGLKTPLSVPTAAQSLNGNGEDRDVDQRADAFIGDFYKKMKLQKVDPYIERLERSYGS
eukprot:c22474_g1_i1 orf=249-1037(+)